MRNLDVFNCKWKCCSSKLWFFGLEEKQLVNVRTGIKPGISHRLTVLMVSSFPELLEFKHGILCDHKGESITCKKSVPWSSPIFAPDWIQSSCFPWKHSSKDNLCDPQHEQLWMEIMFSVKWDPTDHCVCDFCSHIHSDPPSSRAQWQGTARATEPLHAGPDSVLTQKSSWGRGTSHHHPTHLQAPWARKCFLTCQNTMACHRKKIGGSESIICLPDSWTFVNKIPRWWWWWWWSRLQKN